MWRTKVINNTPGPIAVNGEALAPGERVYPYTVTVGVPDVGVVQAIEPDASYHQHVTTNWAVMFVSGSYVHYLGYESSPLIVVSIDADATFSVEGGPSRIAIQPSGVGFVLGPFADDAAERAYIHRRFAALLARQDDPESAVGVIATANDTDFPDVDPVYDIADPNALVAAAVDAHLAEWPLSPDEEITGRALCVLSSDRTFPVLRLTTNLASEYLPLPNVRKADDRLVSEIPGPHPEARRVAVVPPIVLTLAKSVGAALLEKVGAQAWQYVSREVLGLNGVPAYYDTVIARIEQVVAREFDRHRCIEMRALAVQFDIAMLDYHATPNEMLLDRAREKANALLAYAEASELAGTFFYADACMMRLVVLQEAHQRAEPAHKAAAKDHIKAMAAAYRENVQRKHDAFLRARAEKIAAPFYSWQITPFGCQYRTIGGVTEGPHHRPWKNDRGEWITSGFQGFPQVGSWRFDDEENGYWWTMIWDWIAEMVGGKGTNWGVCDRARNQYAAAVDAETRTAIGSLLDVKEQLRRIENQPVPG